MKKFTFKIEIEITEEALEKGLREALKLI